MKLIRPVAITDDVLTETNATETVPAWAVGVTYAQGDRVRNDATHRIYESQMVTGNTGNDPTTDNGTKWLDIEPTNAWAMFDQFSQTQTQAPDAVTVTLEPPGIVDGLALLNIDAAEVTVTVTDALAGEVYSEAFDLVSTSNVGADFYAWAFEPIIRRTDLHVEGLPVYANPTIEVTVSSPGAVASVGNLVIGRQRELGATVYGAGFGIIDSSRKEADDFGNVKIVQRSYRKTGTFEVMVARQMVDEVGRLLTLYRAEPVVYIGTGEFASSIYHGFFRDFRVVVETYPQAKLTIEIEGLA